ncbi:pilus assembly protein PilM [Actomonas aquatica]|uniref:Pilus assembly protein PilM n=1 Tax=Actomonas aquatica TaxID=2866162 RepID=A0ABZ1C807_9BACT|nr:pilus assembly protein PilM [Opitutus sp. WL0086]WRQ87724.1 pilus assembly protein PilM [Opitutus sp. WL0086]
MTLRLRSSSARPLRVIEVGVAHLAAGEVTTGAGGGLSVRRSFERTWTAAEGEPGPELDEALSALREHWGRGGPMQVVIPPHLVLTKVLQVPATATAQRDRIIAFEARQAIPFPLEDVVWDYTLLADTGEQLEVLLAAAKLDALEALLRRVVAAGWEPETVIPASVALALGWRAAPSATEPALVLGVGARSTQLLLVSGADVHLRTLAWGGNQVSRLIAESLGQSAAEAERLKLQLWGGVVELPEASPAAQAVAGALRQFGQRLGGEVRRSLLVQQRRGSAAEAPQRVWLTGAASQAPGWATSLGETLALPVAPWTAGEAGEDLATRAEWWGAVRLLAGAGAEAGSGINLLPPAMAATRRAKRRQPRWWAAAALLVLAVALPGLHYHRLASARTAAAADLRQRLTPHQVWQTQIQDDVVAVERLEQQVAGMQHLLDAQGAWTTFLADLETRVATLDDAWVERLQRLPTDAPDAPERLRLTGRLLDRENPLSRVSPKTYERATHLLQTLVESPAVQAVEGERFEASDPGILRFDFTLVLNPGVGL